MTASRNAPSIYSSKKFGTWGNFSVGAQRSLWSITKTCERVCCHVCSPRKRCDSNVVLVCDLIARNELEGQLDPGLDFDGEDTRISETPAASYPPDQSLALNTTVHQPGSTLPLVHAPNTIAPVFAPGATNESANQSPDPLTTPPLPHPNLAKPTEAQYEAVKSAIWSVLVARQDEPLLTGVQVKADVLATISPEVTLYYSHLAANAAVKGKGSRGVGAYIVDSLCRLKQDVRVSLRFSSKSILTGL